RSTRVIRTSCFRAPATGWLTVSGAGLGGNPGRGNSPGLAALAAPGGGAAGRGAAGPGRAALAAPAGGLPDGDFSFIFETGEREMDDKGLPAASEWAAKYSCGAKRPADDIADTKGGYVYDSTRQNPPIPAWGLLPGPGT